MLNPDKSEWAIAFIVVALKLLLLALTDIETATPKRNDCAVAPHSVVNKKRRSHHLVNSAIAFWINIGNIIMTYQTVNKQDPLTERDRQLIATIIKRTPEEIKTIWIDCGINVWVQLTNGGWLPFDRNWFAQRVAQEKVSLNAQEDLHRRNQQLEIELKQACAQYGLQHSEIDYLMFSTKVYRGRELVGFVGFHRFSKMWTYSRRATEPDRYASSAADALLRLGVRQLALV
ncbi:MAG TPA: hypothetical protein V6D25_03660 [Leptolyngbyaceae cyanobacterium]